MPYLELHRVSGDPDDLPARTRSRSQPLTGRIARHGAIFSATITTR